MLRLAVGARDVEHLREWQLGRETINLPGLSEPAVYTTTRMVPARAAELIAGGSLYWVVKGQIRVRQEFLHIDTVEGEGERPVARLVLRAPLDLDRADDVPSVSGLAVFSGPAYTGGSGFSGIGRADRDGLSELRALGLI